MSEGCLQDTYAPDDICFGCGASNEHGLRLKSFVRGDLVVARFIPAPHHQAFPGVLNGGIIATVLDCHANWAAAYFLMRQDELSAPPCTVTAEFTVRLNAPTPVDGPIDLEARCVEVSGRRANVEATLARDGNVCATLKGLFIAVKPGHPAYVARG